MGVLLLFIDGVGLGAGDPAHNPLLRARIPNLTALLGGPPLAETVGAPRQTAPGVWVRAADPRLGVSGLPQSATGQTTILTGINAAAAIGRHLTSYPTPSLRRILGLHSLFKQVRARGRRPTFLNAYGPPFFERLKSLRQLLAQDMNLPDTQLAEAEAVAEAELQAAGREYTDALARGDQAVTATAVPGAALFGRHGRPGAARRYRPSASTVAVMAAGLTFRNFADLAAGRAVYHDITHWTVAESPGAPPLVEPEEAGRRAAAIASRYDFSMHEHFLTDFAGHGQQMTQAVQVLEIYDRFLGGVLAHLDRQRHLLILVSDHGNIEDLSTRSHTLNPVAAICAGRGAEAACAAMRDLTGVTPAVLAALH